MKTEINKIARLAALLSPMLLVGLSAQVQAAQWLVGVGGGASTLQPISDTPGVRRVDNRDTGKTLMIGLGIDRLHDFQLQYYDLGEARLNNGSVVDFQIIDASILHRFYDSRDLRPGRLGFNVYGYGGLGRTFRDYEPGLEFEVVSDIHFSIGVGAEVTVGENLSMRLETTYFEEDTQYLGLMVVGRFGERGQTIVRPEPGVVGAPEEIFRPEPGDLPQVPLEGDDSQFTIPEVAVNPAIPEADSGVTLDGQAFQERAQAGNTTFRDEDHDGVEDAADQCRDSKPGFPVLDSGCPKLQGILAGVKFETGTAFAIPGTDRQLQSLSRLLQQYPESRVLVRALVGNMNNQSQVETASERLRYIGRFLVSRDIDTSRFKLQVDKNEAMPGSIEIREWHEGAR